MLNKSITRTLLASAVLSAAAALPVQAQDLSGTTVVLVHGAFADGSSWEKVIPLLQAKGLKVVAIQNPLTSLVDDAALAKRVIDAQTGKVVLVGHSWGGAVITQAGVNDKVKALVYVAAFAPNEGEVIGQLGKDFPVPPGIASLVADGGGYLSLPAASVATNFAQDLSPAAANLIYVTQGPINSKAFGESTTVAAWKTKPSYYIVAANDRMIAPGLEQKFAKQINAVKTITLKSSHVPMVSQPKAVADLIIEAATKQ